MVPVCWKPFACLAAWCYLFFPAHCRKVDSSTKDCLSFEDLSCKIDYFLHHSHARFVGRAGRMYITDRGSALSQLLINILTDLLVHLYHRTMFLLVPAIVQSMATIWPTYP
jgi:hypothetical protein